MYKWSIYIRKYVQHHQIWGKCKLNSQGGNIIPHSGRNTIKETTSTGKMTQWTKSLPSVRNRVWISGAYINLDASAIPPHLRQDGKCGQENPQELSGQLAQPMLQGTRISALNKVEGKQSHLYSHAYMLTGISKWTHACTLHMHTHHTDLLNDNN